jgi:hypothetical protein
MRTAWLISTACAFVLATGGMAAAQGMNAGGTSKTMEKSETQSTTGPNATKAQNKGKKPVTAAQRRNDMKKNVDPTARNGNEKVETQSTVGQSRSVGPSTHKSAKPATKPSAMEKVETDKTAK